MTRRERLYRRAERVGHFYVPFLFLIIRRIHANLCVTKWSNQGRGAMSDLPNSRSANSPIGDCRVARMSGDLCLAGVPVLRQPQLPRRSVKIFIKYNHHKDLYRNLHTVNWLELARIGSE